MEQNGTLIVCGDYEGDLKAIAKVLNTFEFDAGENRDQRFVVHDGRISQGIDLAWASADSPPLLVRIQRWAPTSRQRIPRTP